MAQESTAGRAAASGEDLTPVIEDLMGKAHDIILSEGRLLSGVFFEVEGDVVAIPADFSDHLAKERTFSVVRGCATALWPHRIVLLSEVPAFPQERQSVWDPVPGDFVRLRVETPTSGRTAYRAIQRDGAGRVVGLGELTLGLEVPEGDDMAGFYPPEVPTPAEQAQARSLVELCLDPAEIERVARTPRPDAA